MTTMALFVLMTKKNFFVSIYANNEPRNRNSNIGSFPLNSSGCLRLIVIGVEMSYKILFQKTYDLIKWIYPTVNKFPRKQRLILSQRIEITGIRILELIIDFSNRDTETNRRKILYELHKLQILFRLSKDLSYLDFKKYEYLSSLLNDISHIINKRGGLGRNV